MTHAIDIRHLIGLLALSVASAVLAADRPSNVVVIMTDNHGAWTLGCYGNSDIHTPHIDRLASEGILFSQAYASNAVCSPTRATFLTGLLPSQHGVHCYLRRSPLQVGPQAKSTITEFDTLPQTLSESGYECGLVGKWHLGDNTRPQEGFSYWITTPHGGTTTFYNAEIIKNGEIQRYPGYLTDLWTEHACKFITQSASDEKQFFLFLSYNGPYGLSPLLLREAKNRHAEVYADKLLPSFPRQEPHAWLHNNRNYINNPTSIRRYAAELSAIDDGVGEVMQTLQQCGVDRETLVIFTADQGWVGGQGGFWGMGDHTRPLTAYDGMLRIPLIFRQPGKIPADRRTDHMVSNYDMLPSLLNYLGLADSNMPSPPSAQPNSSNEDGPRDNKSSSEAWRAEHPTSPGRDFSPILSGKTLDWEDVVFYEFENTRAIRTDRWKLIARFPDGPDELYHLKDDPDERKNMIGDPTGRAISISLRARLEEFFLRYAEPEFDLWRGGGSKTHLLMMKTPPRPPVSHSHDRSHAR